MLFDRLWHCDQPDVFFPAAAQSRQVGIDIPVQWVADIDGSMTLETFLALPESALTTGQRIPSFGYSAKTYWFKSHLPAADFDGEPRWLQLGPSFIDHLSVFYRPAGSNLPWTHKEFGDHASTRDSDLDYRESVLILAPPLATRDTIWSFACAAAVP